MSESKTHTDMVVNYVPGEECRVAVVENGNLEEFHAERADAVSHVGNIYVGRVTNVEPSIQAAFVDFGLEANGFLHVSDLHPQYFPGEDDDTTERVGKKTPRRERPPIQECLRRGDEVAVQVLKEGVGTKGPTVTSYLSIPGRFLVMMPKMDRVGVSRKVEDEEQRRKMREILDQLELPDGFGFIVRTAGMDRNKTELKRDLAYLQRLWKDMERRWKKGNKPRLLYSESDLLVRALRDMLTTDVDRIVIDNEQALARAARFLKIVAPRSSTKLLRYKGSTPIFHAMGVEQQIRNMYAREVPLPSGGRLVIDETEALVAIDVNSGKMRDARDAETNAYRTNLEAVDEICRQLRLRDLGGIVINDLIDMRSLKHRREIEAKFKDNLKKDRARTTLETISEFGILEMTRQRMRGSHESVHFADCPTCRGRGLVQKPDSVATDAMRELATLLQAARVVRIEMVVSPRIAGELLSSKRRALTRLERSSGKHVDVRISEAVPVDRVTFYCYDDRGADLDVGRLDSIRAREDEFEECDITPAPGDDWAADLDTPDEPEPIEVEPTIEVHDPLLDGFADEPEGTESEAAVEGDGQRGRRRSRRGRGGGGGGRDEAAAGGRGERGGRGGRGGRDDAGGRGDSGRRGGRRDEAARPAEAPARQAAPREELAPLHAAHAAGDHDGTGQAGHGGGGAGAPGGPGGPGGEGGEGGRRRRRRRRGRGRGPGDGFGAPNGHTAPNGHAASPSGGIPILDPILLAASGEGPKVLEPSSWDLAPEELTGNTGDTGHAGSSGAHDDGRQHRDRGEHAGHRDDRHDHPRDAAESGEPDREPGGHNAPRDDQDRGPQGGPDGGGEGERRGRRRRRRRGGRGRGPVDANGAPLPDQASDRSNDAFSSPHPEGDDDGSFSDVTPVEAEDAPPRDDVMPRDQAEPRDESSVEPGGSAEDAAEAADEGDGAESMPEAGPNSEGGEGGGGRRRRRRRRGGRGRGGQADQAGAGAPAPSDAVTPAKENRRRPVVPHIGSSGPNTPERADSAPPGATGGERGGGRDGGRRDGGRREQGSRDQNSRGEQGSRGGRGERGGQRSGGRTDQSQGSRGGPSSPASEPKQGGSGQSGAPAGGAPSTGPAGLPPGVKPVRVLYSSRRKLAPSELKKIKPE